MAGEPQAGGLRQVRRVKVAQNLSFRKSDGLILFLFSGFIFSLSAQPDLAPSFIPSFIFFAHFDKLFHAVEFGVLGYLWLRAFGRAGLEGPPLDGRAMKAAILSLIICLIYAVADESLQSLVPNRIPSVGDLFADGAGAALAIGVGQWVRRRRGLRKGG